MRRCSLPRDLPVSLPSQLVEQRPDMRAAEANLHSASAQHRRRDRQPAAQHHAHGERRQHRASTFQAVRRRKPDSGRSPAASRSRSFTAARCCTRSSPRAPTYDQAAAQYRSTVIIAFQNVADALTAIRTDAVALQKAVVAERAAERSLDITRQRLQLGDINYLALLNAQQTYQQALINLVQAQANRYADTAALFQALGGGWWNRNDVQPDRDYPYFSIFR